MGIHVLPYTSVTGFGGGRVQLRNGLTGEEFERPAGALVTVTARLPVDDLYLQLQDRWQQAGIASLTRIGDCWAPSTIQQAVYTGHKWARELDEEPEGLERRLLFAPNRQTLDHVLGDGCLEAVLAPVHPVPRASRLPIAEGYDRRLEVDGTEDGAGRASAGLPRSHYRPPMG